MNRFLTVAVCVAAVAIMSEGVGRADLPWPTEEQIETQLKETRKKLEALRAEEQNLQKQLTEAKARPRGQITAEIEGVLLWSDEGRSYYIRVRPEDGPKQETRVWLRISEQKVLVRQLEELQGKEVFAKGKLKQMPAKSDASVPSGGMYLDMFFEIKKATRKPPK